MSSGVFELVLGCDGLDVWEQFSGDVSLQATHDFGFRESFGGSSLDVDLGWRVADHSGSDDRPRSGVGVAVATSVESVTVGSARRRFNRR